MSSENDVPLGGESRRYYEQKFGSRIRQVSKGGNVPNKGGGSNWNGRTGVGIAIGVFIIIRIIIALARTESHTPSYTTYTPPPPMKFGIRQVDGELAFPPNAPFQPEAKPDDREADPKLKEEDVPVLEGLCFRIHDESLGQAPAPGQRIWTFLDATDRKLLVKATSDKALNEDERTQLFFGLNTMLQKPTLYDAKSFARVGEVAPLRLKLDLHEMANACRKYNRSLLEKCYPEQIMPYRERDSLNEQDRQAFRQRAQADLDIAKLLRLAR